MKKYILYSHAGSENHGCEALLRTSILVMKNIDKIYSENPPSDKKYGLDKIAKIFPEKTDQEQKILQKIIYSIKYHLKKDDKLYFRQLYRDFIREIDSNAIYISIGGDNYCYHFSQWLEVLNSEINKKQAKTVLWGCSINEDELEDEEVVEDLKKYSLITARETITYNTLKKKLPNNKIYLVPDTAFLLPTEEAKLPIGFQEGNTIGLNISPVILENSNSGATLLENLVELVNYIIDNTEYQIALIPHVVFKGNDDREALRVIRDKCKMPDRTVMISDQNCMALKGIISKCSLFIGARTHSTIAAYSTMVPTLVLGYSVKSLGIAKDLFGTYDNYVLPVQKLESSKELISGFVWLDKNKDDIRKHLKEVMPFYKEKISNSIAYLEQI